MRAMSRATKDKHIKLHERLTKDKDSNIKVVHRDNSTVYQCKKCGAFYDATHKNQARYCCEDRKDYESMKRLKRGWY